MTSTTTETQTNPSDTQAQQPQIVSQPISPPSHNRQHRAIGLIWARYVPSAEEINKGILLTSDGTLVDAVVKGKLLSLVKSKLDLEKEHLWVVYPKTPLYESEIPLHVQMAGIWEPETLHPDTSPANETGYQADDFSINGEVSYQDFEQGVVVVKVKQAAKTEGDRPKFFKLKLKGYLPPKSIKNFWMLKVQRVGTDLVIKSGECIAQLGLGNKRMPPGKKPFNQNRGGSRPSAIPQKGPKKPFEPPKPKSK
ncbi:MAG: hypothetical protein KME64_04825 [Scytonematopsis contorta HA4267-MV1]|jgi:hypothetical protein|nr:hypothetical protein [Scytonematopsis contorta HA4267-MV1]